MGAPILGGLSAVPASRLALTSQARTLIGTGFGGGLTAFFTLSLEVAAR